MRKSFLLILLLLGATSVSFAQTDVPTLFQKPTVNRTDIVFVYAGDLWIVPREGRDAKRLTTGVGTETNPIFSPDGTMIGFTGEYDGNVDVYVVPASGGVPKRLTYHPGPDLAVNWTNDGKRLLFASQRNSYSFFPRLFTIGLEGGLPDELPLPIAERGSYSPDGSQIAYEPLPQWQPDWKRYRGGQQDVIWIAKLSDSSIEKLPRESSNDLYPMWIGEKIYFISDRLEGYSLFAFDTKSKKVEQVVKNGGFDIKSASAWKGAGGSNPVIAYEQFGTIHLYDIKSNKTQKVNIRVAADVVTLRPRFEKVGTRIFNANISPTGARAVFEARGEIITVPAEKGDPRNLTNTTGVMERDPAWSPDGKWIAYFSDELGEYSLHLRDQKGTGEVKKLKLGDKPPLFFFRPTWSADSKKIAYLDKQLNLWYLEIDKGTPVKIDNNPIGLRSDVLIPAWSPDSRWIAYVKQLPNLLRAVFFYSLDTGKATQVTDGMSDARYPVFDKNGKYLYFTASTDIGPNISFADLSRLAHRSTSSVYAVVLRNDIPSPLAPESDEEKVDEEKKEGEKKSDDKPADQSDAKKPDAPAAKPGEKKEPEPVRVDLDGIDQRIVAFSMIPARNYIGLSVGKANNIYCLEQPLAPAAPGQVGFTVHKFDLEKRKFDKALDGITSFQVSANGEKALYRQGFTNWVIAPVATLGGPAGPGGPGGPPGGAPPAAPGGPGPVNPSAGPNILKTADMEVYVDPKVEWKQMYNEVWRNERDFFYDRNLHGMNLEEMKKRYAPYVEAVAHRSDLTYLFAEMLNQLTVGHMFVGGHTAPDAAVYGLNGEWEVENVGVGPDIEVEMDPKAWREGRDPQLEKGVEWLLEELKKNPRPQYKRPPYPDYYNGRTTVRTGN